MVVRPHLQNLMPGEPTASTVNDMTVAEVRKSLSYMRREWLRHSCVLPFFPCQLLPQTDITVAEFAFRFVMGHHHKRHQKSG